MEWSAIVLSSPLPPSLPLPPPPSPSSTIRIWNFETGEQMHTLYGHTNRVFRVQFDRFKIISSSQDDRILIWDFYEHGRKAAHEQQLMLEPDAQDGGAAAAAGDGDDGRFDRPAMMSGML